MAASRTLSTADLPDGFRVDPDDLVLRAVARRAGLTAACGHDECLARAVRELLTVAGVDESKVVAPTR